MAKNQSSKYSKEFLDKTIEVWQPHSPTPLSLNDAREITENMTALFDFLIRHDENSNE
jgi:flagellin-specific chaperone FliS